ncbi:DeoR/GlpR family DNA-binding transcription regulator [Alkalicoccobacillus porphyridii]|uniref:DeoR/GlpR transcriptional regulator n=1 Tax=Alkalicoccobacillus porphyridii TaxID=2597270 RepID=A0A553ZVA7_9BACI|nr:DeoR/GlpR family DNA-binding transcription regulator [Alkalicoccobacillus porphyridii]TSB45414.1 DeoR/GlpR transcriptional regulator [Alkalicoccobacillus porphyridii]
MLSLERHEQLLGYLNEHKALKVSVVSELLKVTEKTIRLDLEELEKRSLLQRVHGGAVLRSDDNSLFPEKKRQSRHQDKKKLIAQKALATIQPQEVILLDGGSTTYALAELLGEFPVTVITNDIEIAHNLYAKEKVQLMMLGGSQLGATTSLFGKQTLEALSQIYVSRLFLGATGISIEHGLTVLNSFHYDWKSSVIGRAKHVCLLADSTKFEQVGLMKFAGIEDIDELITDSELDQRIQHQLAQTTISITIA